MHLCKSRLREAAVAVQRDVVRTLAKSSVSANQLYHADPTLAGNPLLLKKANRALMGRRDEIVFSQMRLGCSAYHVGPRWARIKPETCRLCSGKVDADHVLLSCAALSAPRGQMRADILQEREDASRKRAGDDVRHGRSPRAYPIKRRIDRSVLSQHPDAVLRFIQCVPLPAAV